MAMRMAIPSAVKASSAVSAALCNSSAAWSGMNCSASMKSEASTTAFWSMA
jgi:hypothetical protein